MLLVLTVKERDPLNWGGGSGNWMYRDTTEYIRRTTCCKGLDFSLSAAPLGNLPCVAESLRAATMTEHIDGMIAIGPYDFVPCLFVLLQCDVY